ncbi:MAG: hypothetical protein VKL39_21305 [Leptolyngbyaceae bacterium]|nr:hypothetical protein [Leptolyngbyaceae bacterium]
MTTTIATINGLKTVPYKPKPGEHQLSINLGLADLADVFDLASSLGVKPEVVQIPCRDGIEIHALLISEMLPQSPLAGESELSARLDEFADQVGADAIRHVYGRSKPSH